MAKERMGTRARLEAVERSLEARLGRVRARLLPITQTAVAGGVAYWIANSLVGHEQPFFSAISAIIIIGIAGGQRISKAWDVSLGCILSVLIGDLIFYRLGTGAWQVAVIVGGALVVAAFMSRSPLVSSQVAIGSVIIATIMPPGGEVTGIDRSIDSFIGAAVAMATLALLPQGPVGRARQEVSTVMSLASSVLDDVARGLRTLDARVIEDALASVQTSQSEIGQMSAAVASGAESARLSPFLWGTRRYVNSLQNVIPPVSNAVRSSSVLARRAHVLCEDRDSVSEEQIEILDALARVCLDISHVYERHSDRLQSRAIPRAVNELRRLAGRAGTGVVEEGSVLSAYVVLAQTRSLIVDLLMVCGMSRESAMAALAPTSEHPKYPPEHYA